MTTTPKKRLLFSQYDSPSPKKQYDDRKTNISGYVLNVQDENEESKNYYDLILKSSPKDVITVRVTRRANPNISKQMFLKLKEKPVMLSNITSTERKDVYFYNSVFGSTVVSLSKIPFKITDLEATPINELKDAIDEKHNIIACFRWNTTEEQTSRSPVKKFRDGVIYDDSGYIPITLWENQINQVEDNQCYSFTNIRLKNFYHLKATTTLSTVIKKSNRIKSSDLDWTPVEMTDFKKIEKKAIDAVFPTLCCPEILSVNVSLFPICSNPVCKKKIELRPVEADQKRVTCEACGFRLNVSSLELTGTVTIVLLKSGVTEKLTAFADVLDDFFQISTLNTYGEKQEEFEDLILDIENADFTYSSSKKVITKITHHEEKEELI